MAGWTGGVHSGETMKTIQISRTVRASLMTLTIAAVTAFGILGAGWATPVRADGTVPGGGGGGASGGTLGEPGR